MSKNDITETGESMGIVAPLDDGEWEVRQEEQPDKLIFDTIGDEYTGLYAGMVTITPDESDHEPWEEATFWDPEGYKGIPSSKRLKQGLRNVAVGELVKLRYIKGIDVGQQSDMKDFKVWARPAPAEFTAKVAELRKRAGV